MPFTVHNIHIANHNILILYFKNPITKKEKLTVRSRTQKGREKGEFESEVYSIVSFSAPKRIASSNKIAKNETTQNKTMHYVIKFKSLK